MKRIYKRNHDIVYRKVLGEAILVPIRGSLADMQRIFALNPVGEFIWDELDGSKNLQQISEGIQVFFDVTGLEADADVSAFISELLREGLIEGTP